MLTLKYIMLNLCLIKSKNYSCASAFICKSRNTAPKERCPDFSENPGKPGQN